MKFLLLFLVLCVHAFAGCDVYFREMVEADIPFVAENQLAVRHEPLTRDQVLALAGKEKAVVLIAEDAFKNVIGHAIFEVRDKEIVLSHFVVHPGFQKQQIGYRMMVDLKSRLRDGGPSELVITVVDTNFAARLFLEKQGFVPDSAVTSLTGKPVVYRFKAGREAVARLPSTIPQITVTAPNLIYRSVDAKTEGLNAARLGILNLEKKLGDNGWSEEMMKLYFETEGVFSMMALDPDSKLVIGHMMYRYAEVKGERRIRILRIAVDPARQNQGVARELIQAKIGGLGMTHATLEIAIPMDAGAALSFARGNGLKVKGDGNPVMIRHPNEDESKPGKRHLIFEIREAPTTLPGIVDIDALMSQLTDPR